MKRKKTDDPFLSKVEETIRRYELMAPGQAIAAAVSGGPDSMALLHALHWLAPKWGWTLTAFHVNHGLRGRESGLDAQRVNWTTLSLDVPYRWVKYEHEDIEEVRRTVSEEELRQWRYESLVRMARDEGVAALAVGHHRDDQAETVLMKFLRGAGPAGLGGFRPKTLVQGVTVVRPLYDCTREEILQFCARRKIKWREDRSNRDPRFLRNRIRHELLPLLESEYNPNVRALLADNARWFQEDERYFEARAREVLERRLGPPGDCVRSAESEAPPDSIPLERLNALETPVLARVLRLWIMAAAGRAMPPGGRQVEDLIERVRRGEAGGGEVRCAGDVVFFVAGKELAWQRVQGRNQPVTAREGEGVVPDQAVAARDSWPVFELSGLVALSGETDFEALSRDRRRVLNIDVRRCSRRDEPAAFDAMLHRAVENRPEALEQFFDSDKIAGRLTLRHRVAHDRFHPLGAPGAKRLKDFLIDAKVPESVRGRLVLVCDDEKIFWVVGVRIGHAARLTDATKTILQVRVQIRPTITIGETRSSET